MAYGTALKTPINMSAYWLVFWRDCHLLVELEHWAYWAVKSLNFALRVASEKRLFQLNEKYEFWLEAYENVKLYKESIEMHLGSNKSYYYNSRLKLSSG